MERLLSGSDAANVQKEIIIMRKISISALLFFTLILCSCSGGAGIDNFEWLNGKWQGKGFDSTVYDEIWKKESDKLMIGFSCGSINPDTFFRENPKIEIVEGKAFYITAFPDIKGSVLFKSTSVVPNHAVFENDEHPFPSKIEYKIEGDSLLVRYEGKRQGKLSREEMYFHRVK